MSSRVVVSLVLLLASAGLPASPSPAQSSHDGQAHASHALPSSMQVPAHRWATDASLRDGMQRIHRAVGELAHYEHGHMDAAGAARIADAIDAAVNDMIANCKLAPEADAALHGLLAEFLAGAKALREAHEPPLAKIAQMRDALARYPQLFDDPQWGASAD